MKRSDLLLAALSPAEGRTFSPVQVQKLMFLIDRKIPAEVGGPHYSHRPYDYGPFDRGVYDDLEMLRSEGLVEISRGYPYTTYRLTDEGQDVAEKTFSGLTETAQAYIQAAVDFVRGLSFSGLVQAIYKAFPEMRANSVFQG